MKGDIGLTGQTDLVEFFLLIAFHFFDLQNYK